MLRRPSIASFILSIAFLAAPAGALQTTGNLPFIRPLQNVDAVSLSRAEAMATASEGDLSVVLWQDSGSSTLPTGDPVYCVASDGRGLLWTNPVRVDRAPLGATKGTAAIAVEVSGQTVYTAWIDNRNGSASDIYFNRSLDGGRSFGASDVLLDKGLTGRVVDWRMVVSNDTAGDHVYVAMTVDNGPNELFLNASHDGGSTWTGANPVVSFPGVDAENVALAAEGLTVHLLWADNRFGGVSPGNDDDVWFRSSLDGGLTWTRQEVQIDASGPLGDAEAELELAVRGTLVVAAWLEEVAHPFNEEVRVAVSTDGGSTFAPDTRVGSYDPVTDDVDQIELAISDAGISVVWDDSRGGGRDDVFASFSEDLGQTWSADVQVSLLGGSTLAIDGAGDTLGLSWDSIASTNQKARGAFSRDGGRSWMTPLNLSAGNSADVDGPNAVAFNALYSNFIHAWPMDVNGMNRCHVGGYRPQTILPGGVVAGPTTVQFQFEHFSGDHGIGQVLLSVSSGSLGLTHGDFRTTGLSFDPLLVFVLGRSDLFVAPLSASGAGTTSTFAASLPAGLTFSMVGLSLDLSQGVAYGELTDVQNVTVN